MDRIGPGTLLAGRYRLQERMEADEAVSSWRAEDLTLERPVGVKVLAADHARVQSTLDAARRAALVDDPRLQRVLGVGIEGGAGYVVLEWVTGQDAAALAGKVSEQEAVRIVTEAAEALRTAATRSLHHGRVGPHQVIRSSDGSVRVVGTAIDVAAAGQATPAAAARPEARDVRDLMAVLYALSTGRWPFGGLGGLEAAPTDRGRPVPARQLRDDLSRPLDGLLDETLSGGGADTLDRLVGQLHETRAALASVDPATGAGAAGAAAAVGAAAVGAAAGAAAAEPAGTDRPQTGPWSPRSTEDTDVITPVPARTTPGSGAAATAGSTAGAAAAGAASTGGEAGGPTVGAGAGTSGAGAGAGAPAPAAAGAGTAAGASAGAAGPGAAGPAALGAGALGAGALGAGALGAAALGSGAGSGTSDRAAARRAAGPTAPTGQVREGAAGAPAARGWSPSPRPAPPPPPPAEDDGWDLLPLADQGYDDQYDDVYDAYDGYDGYDDGQGAPAVQDEVWGTPQPWDDDEQAWPGPVEGRPAAAPVLPRGRRPARRRPAGAGTGVIVVLVMGAFVVGGLVLALDRFDDPEVVAAPVPTVTQTVAPPSVAPSPAAPSVEPEPEPSEDGVEVLSPAGVQPLDPQGDGEENDQDAPRAIDGDPGTSWQSQRYNSQDFGGLKDGLGLVFDLGEPREVVAVLVDAPGSDGTYQIRTADGPGFDGSTEVATGETGDDTVEVVLEEPVTTQFVLVWFTALPENDGDWRGAVNEVEVRVQ